MIISESVVKLFDILLLLYPVECSCYKFFGRDVSFFFYLSP